MAITGKVFRLEDGKIELDLRLDFAGVQHLNTALNRALNTWDPKDRPEELLNLSDKLHALIEDVL